MVTYFVRGLYFLRRAHKISEGGGGGGQRPHGSPMRPLVKTLISHFQLRGGGGGFRPLILENMILRY